MGKALFAVCGFGLGVLAGLFAAQATGGRLVEVLAERDRLRAEVASGQEKLARADIASALADSDMSRIRREMADLKDRCEAFKRGEEQAIEAWLKSQAFLEMLIEYPILRERLLSADFHVALKADWSCPKFAYQIIGGRWLLEEMVERDMLDRKLLPAAAAKPGTGDRSTLYRTRSGR